MRIFTSRVGRWLERLAGSFYEGPEPPARLAGMVADFAELNPRATRAEWVELAARLAREAYRSGYRRGYEHAERDPRLPDPSPDVVADYETPGWREGSPAFRSEMTEPDAVVLDAPVLARGGILPGHERRGTEGGG